MKDKSKNNTNGRDPEFGVDSRYKTKRIEKLEGKLLMEARLKRLQNLSKSDIAKAKLLQLKLTMDEFLTQPVQQDVNHFTKFLITYVDMLYEKRKHFAEDINIKPVSLSQVLNNHREPKEEFMLRLMLHSELVFKNIIKFHKRTWYQIYYHQKVCDTMSSQEEWRPKVEKYVKFESTL